MNITQEIWDFLMGNGTVQALETVMAQNFEDFAETQQKYFDAIAVLQESLGDSAVISPEEVMKAIEQQTASYLLFAGLLGFKANWDHFIDPVARTFLEAGPEVYLREDMAHILPDYICAQETRTQFYTQLSSEQRKIYEDIIAHTCYLETAGPKLAHYFGYILGNDMLQRIVPGYRPDYVLTRKYTAMLETYFGKNFLNIAVMRLQHF